MTQPGETDGFTASKHLETLINHTSPDIVDCCVLNDAASDTNMLLKYSKDNSFSVIPDIEKINKMGYIPIATDLINESGYIRHDSYKLAASIMRVYSKWKKKHKK